MSDKSEESESVPKLNFFHKRKMKKLISTLNKIKDSSDKEKIILSLLELKENILVLKDDDGVEYTGERLWKMSTEEVVKLFEESIGYLNELV